VAAIYTKLKRLGTFEKNIKLRLSGRLGLLTTPERIRTSDPWFRNTVVKSAEDSKNKDLRSQPGILCRPLGQIIEKHPELEQIIEAWESLPEEIKQSIIEITENK